MENHSFKTVAFGGFDKQDVVRYLEQVSDERRKLEEENEELRKETGELSDKAEELRKQVKKLTAQRDCLQKQLDKESAARKELEALRSLEEEVARLTAEADALRSDAEAYARLRERLGAIECEARNRAVDLEDAAADQTRQMTETFRSQYQRLMGSFTSTASHVAQELQSLSVAMAQLPRSMEKPEAELKELMRCLEKGKDGHALYFSKGKEEAPAKPGAPKPPVHTNSKNQKR